MQFKKIALKNVHYSYPKANRTSLEDITLEVPFQSTVGIVGTTGSGKTTLVDLILGLLKPKTGKIEVDSQVINEHNLRSWQRCIGYVPQNIYS